VVGCFEYGNEPSGSLKVQEFPHINKKSALCCYCVIYCSINIVDVVPE
jgi:hypothetical protein